MSLKELTEIVKMLPAERAFIAGLCCGSLEQTDLLQDITNDLCAAPDSFEALVAIYTHYTEAMKPLTLPLKKGQALRTVQLTTPSKVTLDHVEGSHPEIIAPEELMQIDTYFKHPEADKTSFDCLLEDVPMP